MVIRGMNTVVPILVPVSIIASIRCVLKFRHVSLVPLHKPAAGLIFRSSIIGAPVFRISLCCGIPGGSVAFKKSVGYDEWWAAVLLSTVSELRYMCSLPGNLNFFIIIIYLSFSFNF